MPPPTPDAVERSLSDVVIENLDDDGPRFVLADHWMEQGDPRGELVMRQLTLPGDAAVARRMMRERHRFLGELDRWIERPAFSRGFLSSCTLRVHGPLVTFPIDSPLWRTVEQLDAAGADLPIAELIERMPRLTSLTGVHEERLESVRDAARRHPMFLSLDIGWPDL